LASACPGKFARISPASRAAAAGSDSSNMDARMSARSAESLMVGMVVAAI
jgi:hypothetical protein